MILALILASCFADRDCLGRIHQTLFREILRSTDSAQQEQLRKADGFVINRITELNRHEFHERSSK